LSVVGGLPAWANPATPTGFDFSILATSTNATPVNIYTNTVAENSSVSLQAKVLAAGSTNNASFDIHALARRGSGSASLVNTNNDVIMPVGANSYQAYWTISGNDALLQVIGLTNFYTTWKARGWADVAFNGTNTYAPYTAGFSTGNYFSRSSVPTGFFDSTAFTLSDWVDFTGGDGVAQRMVNMRSASNSRFSFEKTTANLLRVTGHNSANVNVLLAETTQTYTAAAPAGWVHHFVYVSLSNTNNRAWFTNGVQDTSVVWTTYDTTGTIDFSMATTPTFGVGAIGTGVDPLTGSQSELWLELGMHTNVSAFYAEGRPVALGSTGSVPTGAAPKLYFSGTGSGTNWNNSASASTFTVNGTPSSPSPPP
jgi:hypothetical protein